MDEREIIGSSKYVNKNCWLARTLGYPPYKRCQFCEQKFRNCLFLHYQAISTFLIVFFLIISFIIDGGNSRLLIVSVFTLVIVYGYFFNKSTDKIISANFTQRKANESLEELSRNLQKKVEEQTKDIREAYEVEKKAREELERLDKSKNQFLLTIQHHLRTPLTAMMGYSDLLLKGQFGKPSRQIAAVIKKCQASTMSLIKMVNELLDITQFQLGKDVVCLKSGVDAGRIVEDIVDNLKFETKSKGIYLKFKKPEKRIFVKADQEKLRAAIYNIIDNAVKYTQKGGVEVSLEDARSVVKIMVEDTGMGISSENISSMFDKTFERGEQAKKTFTTGRGIGLYLSSQIIKAHKGNIYAKSEGEGKGSTFVMELPISEDANYGTIK